MPHMISWLVEGRVVLVYMAGSPDLEEASVFDQEIRSYLQEATAPLAHVILNVSELEQLPSLTTLSKFHWPRHPKTGWMVVYPQPNRITGFVMSVASQLFNARFRPFDTLDETLAFLQEVDSTLPDLSNVTVTPSLQSSP